MTSDTTAGQTEETKSPQAQDTDARASIAARLREARSEREGLKARLDDLQVRERTLWAAARDAGVSFGRIAAVSGVDRATVFYALNPRTTVESRKAKGGGGDDA